MSSYDIRRKRIRCTFTMGTTFLKLICHAVVIMKIVNRTTWGKEAFLIGNVKSEIFRNKLREYLFTVLNMVWTKLEFKNVPSIYRSGVGSLQILMWTVTLVTFKHICFHVIINLETFKSAPVCTWYIETLNKACLVFPRSYGVCGCVNRDISYFLQVSNW